MNDFTFIQAPCPRLRQPQMYPAHLGVLYLMAVLERAGATVAFADLRYAPAVTPSLLDVIPPAQSYAFTATTGEINACKQLAAMLKRRDPHSQTVIGGPHATHLPEDCLPHFDVVARYEWENTIKLLRPGDRGVIEGTMVTDLDAVPFPARHLVGEAAFSRELLPGERHGSGERATMITSSRGCSFHCLVGSSPVLMATGDEKRISEVKVGDWVWTKDGLACVIASAQTKADSDIITLTVEGRTLSCTPDHLIFTPEGWKEAQELGTGDEVAVWGLACNAGWPNACGDSTSEHSEAQGRRPLATSPQSRRRGEQTPKVPNSLGYKAKLGREVRPTQACHREDTRPLEGKDDRTKPHEGRFVTGEDAEFFACQPGVPPAGFGQNEDEQSNEAPRGSGQAKQVHETTPCRISGPPAKDKGRGQAAPWHNDRGKQSQASGKNEKQQPYAEPRGSPKSRPYSAVATPLRPEGLRYPVGPQVGRPEQSRTASGGAIDALGLQVRRRWEVLDWPLPEWEVQESRLYIQERAAEDGALVSQPVLAWGDAQRRRGGIKGLSSPGVAGLCSVGRGVTRSGRKGQGLVRWAKVTSIAASAPEEVYDIEVWPHHNFIASGVVVHNCSFCAGIFPGRIRFRSPDNVVAEVQELVDRYHCRAFRDEADNLVTNKPWLLRYCALLSPLGVRWKAHGRSDLLDDDRVRALKEAGCVQFGLGVESADPRVLEKVNKRETVEDHRRAIALLKQHGILSCAYFIMGLPGETNHTLELNKQFVRETQPDRWSCFHFIPFPGSDVWNYPTKYGAMIDRHAFDDYWLFFGESSSSSGYPIRYKDVHPDVLNRRYREMYEFLLSEEWKRL